MKLHSIITWRKFMHYPSYDLVYEWEDIFAQEMQLPFHYEWEKGNNKYVRRIPILSRFGLPWSRAFMFEMVPTLHFRRYNTTRIIPCLIDFFLSDEELGLFQRAYRRNPLVLISSREVYEHLKDRHLKLNIAHFPLSISDRYVLDESVLEEKKYDLVLMGRQNPVLMEYLKKYVETHPDLYYVYRVHKNNQFLYFTSRGESLGDVSTRFQYIDLMRKSRIGLYATPGIDAEEEGRASNGYHQVTPRFLEYIACGCQVLARYKKNADTDYFQLDKICKSLDSYEEFESAMNAVRNTQVDLEQYRSYLPKHRTSVRVRLLKDLISKI